MTNGERGIQPLPKEIRVAILQSIITENNGKMCALQEESNRCRDELLKLGAEAYPPFPKPRDEVELVR